MDSIKWVLQRLKTYWFLIAFALIGSLLDGAATAGVSLLIKSLVDRVFLLKEGGEVMPLVLTLMGLVLIAQAGKFATAFFSSLYTELEMKRLREEAFGRLLRADYSAFLGVSPGDFASRVISDMTLYRNLIGSYGVKLFKEPPTVLFLLGVLFYRDWLLTLNLFILLPLLSLSLKYFGKKRSKHIKRAQEGYAGVTERLFSSFSGFETIRSFRAQGLFENLFQSLNSALFRSSLRSEVYAAMNTVFNFTFGYLVVALVILYGAHRISQGALTPGDFVSYLTALLFLQMPLMETQKGFLELRSALPVVQRIRELLSLKEEREGNVALQALTGSLRAERLSFGYAGREILKEISFQVNRGEKLGIMGDTGSGKSTLLRVLAGLLPYEGSLRLDGVELSELKREDLRQNLIFLSQEPFVLPGTVRENMLVGGSDSEEAMWKALELARCDFVHSLDQHVSPKSLSGGEKQRLALARIFLKNPPVLLLDEATSALDAKVEAEVLENLFKTFDKSILILVAHRFSNLIKCDRVLVLKEGRAVFCGKPKEAIDFFLQSP